MKFPSFFPHHALCLSFDQLNHFSIRAAKIIQNLFAFSHRSWRRKFPQKSSRFELLILYFFLSFLFFSEDVLEGEADESIMGGSFSARRWWGTLLRYPKIKNKRRKETLRSFPHLTLWRVNLSGKKRENIFLILFVSEGKIFDFGAMWHENISFYYCWLYASINFHVAYV